MYLMSKYYYINTGTDLFGSVQSEEKIDPQSY